ncbi:sigma factor-like helix-turn-helix DNA-binding protein [Streptomyces europaeiscabiei]|uniref:sigma factor-like helix-turn-helix DNA-binding protein n=1 Tax=Streptomyces europaeiscabiei TaxID=146819 RepID=UPI0029AF4DB5|nr:sigma factor-like helix-turn-helix DNA-binding protein [Streptomyces europaeiscabiei]MDX3666969.1 sigma factor-like helix-turn-helix DNA-binding protein [Streptomyces europaeiscabiei]
MGMPKRVDAKRAEQARRCYELDLAGFSQRQIAEKVGISQTTVHNRLKEHIHNRVHRKADEWRDRQLDDLMVLRRKLVGAIESGDIKAIGQAVRIWERISRLMGTDSATLFKVEANVHNRETDRIEVARLMEEFFGAPTSATEPKVIPHIDLTQRRRRPFRMPSGAVATNTDKTSDEFADAIPAGQLQKTDPEPVEEFEPAPQPKARRKSRTIPNPAAQFLRDADD